MIIFTIQFDQIPRGWRRGYPESELEATPASGREGGSASASNSQKHGHKDARFTDEEGFGR